MPQLIAQYAPIGEKYLHLSPATYFLKDASFVSMTNYLLTSDPFTAGISMRERYNNYL